MSALSVSVAPGMQSALKIFYTFLSGSAIKIGTLYDGFLIKKFLKTIVFRNFPYVRERIRTPDTLVRSQVLYPAELRTHILFTALAVMPATGIEPVLYCYNGILSPARLPVPPRRQII
jgi:hypothetical protein